MIGLTTHVVMSYRPKDGKRKGPSKKTIRESMYTFVESHTL